MSVTMTEEVGLLKSWSLAGFPGPAGRKGDKGHAGSAGLPGRDVSRIPVVSKYSCEGSIFPVGERSIRKMSQPVLLANLQAHCITTNAIE